MVEFLGSYESVLADVLLASGEGRATVEALVGALRAEPRALVDLYGMPGDSPLLAALDGEVTAIERIEAPVLDMPDGWEAAYARLTSSKRRNQNRRRERQLAEQGTVEVAVGGDAAGVAALLEDAFAVHDARWAGRNDGSTFGQQLGRRFHRVVLPRLAEEGGVRLVVLRLDGRPVAFALVLLVDRCCYLYRNAFDPAFARFGAGLWAIREGFALAAQAGASRVEYMGGGEQFKLDLSDRLEPLYEAIGMARGIRGRLAALAGVQLIHARKRLKRSETLHRIHLEGLGSLRRSRRPDSAAGDSSTTGL